MRLIGLALVALFTVSCEKESGPQAPVTAPPDPVVATVSLVSPERAVAAVRAYLDAANPGSAGMIAAPSLLDSLAGGAGATSLEGIDVAGPLHVIIADLPVRFVIAGRVTDGKRLEAGRGEAKVLLKGGWALIGSAELVDLVDDWALSTLVASKPSTVVAATAYLDRLMQRHADELGLIRGQVAAGAQAAGPGGDILVKYVDGLFSVAGETARVTATLALDASRADLDLALVPKPSTGLGRFVAAQRPSDFSVVGSLPATAPTSIVVAGHLVLGPYRDALFAAMTRMMNFGEAEATMMRTFTAIAEVATGEFAAGMKMGPGEIAMVQIISITDAAVADRAVKEMATATAGGLKIESMGMRLTQTGKPDASSHDGIPIHDMTTTVDLDSVPAEQRETIASMYGPEGQTIHAAATAGALIVSTGSVENTGSAIDAFRDKAARVRLSPSISGFLDAARGRKDSMVFIMDLAALAAGVSAMAGGATPPPAGEAPLAMAFGFADKNAHLRFSLPSSSLARLSKLR
jgi:hypothetical protein